MSTSMVSETLLLFSIPNFDASIHVLQNENGICKPGMELGKVNRKTETGPGERSHGFE